MHRAFEYRLLQLERSRCTDILDIFFNIPEDQRIAFKQVMEETLAAEAAGICMDEIDFLKVTFADGPRVLKYVRRKVANFS